jgi:Ca2+-binding RTX toxin-like protein
MASINGSQFVATAGAATLNVGYDSNGIVPPAVPGDFNLEVYTGSGAYQGLLIDDGGQYVNLLAGAFALTDTGSGGHFLQASADSQTISGAPGDVILTQEAGDSVTGDGNVVLGYGDWSTFNLATGNNYYIGLSGNADTILGGSGDNFVYTQGTNADFTGSSGNDTVIAGSTGTGDSVAAGSGNDLVVSLGDKDTVNAGSGSDTVDVVANDDSLKGGTGSLSAVVDGTGNTVTGGQGPDSVIFVGDGNTFQGGAGPDTVSMYGNSDAVQIGSGAEMVTVMGSADSVTAGSGPSSADMFGSTNATFADNSGAVYADTLVGFNDASGDTIQLESPNTAAYALAHQQSVNGGADTLVTLNDGSTILLKGVSSVSGGFFS